MTARGSPPPPLWEEGNAGRFCWSGPDGREIALSPNEERWQEEGKDLHTHMQIFTRDSAALSGACLLCAACLLGKPSKDLSGWRVGRDISSGSPLMIIRASFILPAQHRPRSLFLCPAPSQITVFVPSAVPDHCFCAQRRPRSLFLCPAPSQITVFVPSAIPDHCFCAQRRPRSLCPAHSRTILGSGLRPWLSCHQSMNEQILQIAPFCAPTQRACAVYHSAPMCISHLSPAYRGHCDTHGLRYCGRHTNALRRNVVHGLTSPLHPHNCVCAVPTPGGGRGRG